MQLAQESQSTRRAAVHAPTEPSPGAGRVTLPDRSRQLAHARSLTPLTMVEDKYRLKGLLGRGGMAEVMLAHDLALDREVALKFLGTSLLSDSEWRQRFVAEARSMARVNHPNVAQVFAYGVHSGWPYFAMEYVRGTTLAEWVRATPRPSIAQIVEIVDGIAQGLQAIHSAGLAHHDIKPTNILMGDDGRIVVSDLGLARVANGVGGRPGVSGTLHYMAPEQFSPRSLQADMFRQTDVYQLGITVYEMLTGKVPFHGEDARSIIRRHRAGSIPPVTAARPDLEPEIDAVIATALAREPAKRFESALAFSQALAELAPARPSARRSSMAPRRKLRVLIADDDEFLRAAMGATVTTAFPAEVEVDFAADGDGAADAIARKRYDIRVLDQHMPGSTGLEVAAAASSRGAPRLIMVTAEGGAAEWRALRDLGGDALLLKPFDADQLIDAIHRCATLLTDGGRRRDGAAPVTER